MLFSISAIVALSALALAAGLTAGDENLRTLRRESDPVIVTAASAPALAGFRIEKLRGRVAHPFFLEWVGSQVFGFPFPDWIAIFRKPVNSPISCSDSGNG